MAAAAAAMTTLGVVLATTAVAMPASRYAVRQTAAQPGSDQSGTTVTGCVFRTDDGHIQLRSPSGTFNLVASGGNADPGAHVGHTVTVSGTLARPIPGSSPDAPKELDVSSVTPVSQACR